MSKPRLSFTTAAELEHLINGYFGETDEQSAVSRSEPATIAGLAFHLGFSSRQAFEQYETDGKFAEYIKRACLRIMGFRHSRTLPRPSAKPMG